MATNVLELRRPGTRHALRADPSEVRIRDRHDIRAAAAALEDGAGQLGLRIIAWHDLATLEPMVDAAGEPLDRGPFGWNAEELAPWHDFERALRSPLLRAARLAAEPLWLNSHGIHTSLCDRALDQLALNGFDEVSFAGAAIIVPVHMPFGQIGAAILVSRDPRQTSLAAEFTEIRETLAPAITRFITGYVAVSRDTRYLPADSQLSGREIECLSWVAHGKTDYEISIILGCSHAGVRYHVTRACTKLGAVNRAQSVFRACQLGYLGPTAARSSRHPA